MSEIQHPCHRTIMVIEDDRDIRDAVKEILESENYKVVTAGNGKEALELLRATANQPRLVLLDMMMPVMDGFDFLKILTNDTVLAAIPVYIHSANYDIRDLRGAKGLLRKPASCEAILALVESYCI